MENGIKKKPLKMEEINENLYGAHLLVDFRPIEEADGLLTECENFIQQVRTGMMNIPFTIPSLRNWRAKRRDSRLLSVYESLHPRVIAVEKILRNIIGEVVEKKIALRLQARYLQVRLQACIEYNKQNLKSTEEPLEDLREYVNKLSGESSYLKTMILFNKEVLRMKNIESISKGKSFVRWGAKPAARRNLTDAELNADKDHQLIQGRLEGLRKIREKFVSFLASILESRGMHMANLDNCERSLESITNLIRRGGTGTESIYIEDESTVEVPNFDHSRCSDCSYGYSITCDCTNHLSALQKQALEANQRLQALVEMREKMSEASEELSLSVQAAFVASGNSNPSVVSYSNHQSSSSNQAYPSSNKNELDESTKLGLGGDNNADSSSELVDSNGSKTDTGLDDSINSITTLSGVDDPLDLRSNPSYYDKLLDETHSNNPIVKMNGTRGTFNSKSDAALKSSSQSNSSNNATAKSSTKNIALTRLTTSLNSLRTSSNSPTKSNSFSTFPSVLVSSSHDDFVDKKDKTTTEFVSNDDMEVKMGSSSITTSTVINQKMNDTAG